MSKIQFGKIRKIRQSRKDAVFGYIRRDKLLKNQQIPNAIIYICLLFYGDIDEFDTKWKGKSMTLSNDNRKVEYKSCEWTMQSVYGKKIIDSGHHEWKFKLIKFSPKDDGGFFMLGLWRCSNDRDPPLRTYFTDGKDQGYGYDPAAATKSDIDDGRTCDEFGVEAANGDIVEMIVDFDKLSLCWKVNGKSIGKSHDITQGNYRMAIYMGDDRDKTVEIIE